MASTVDDSYRPPQPGMKGYTPDVDGSPNRISTLFKGAGHLLDSGSSLVDLLDYLKYARDNGGLGSDGVDTLNDFCKQLVDQLIANQLRDEQRQYDNPLAQVQRLMAAGMSRDAALQALNGGQQPISGTEGLAPTESASNSASAREANAAAVSNYAGTVYGGVNSLLQLAQFGVQMPLMMNQIGMSNNALWLSDQQKAAYQQFGQFNALVNQQMASGGALDVHTPGRERVLDSFADMANALRANPSTAAYMQQQFDQANANPFFRQMAESAFNHSWSTAGVHYTPEVIDNALALQRHEVALKALGVEDLSYKVHTLNFAEFNKMEAATGLLNEQIATQLSMRNFMAAQTEHVKAQTEVAYTTNDQLSYQNDLLAPEAAIARGLLGSEEFMAHKMDAAMSNMFVQMTQWQAMAGKPDLIEESVNAFFANQYNQAAYLNWQARLMEADAKYGISVANYQRGVYEGMDDNGFTSFIKGYSYMRNNTFLGDLLDKAEKTGMMIGGAALLKQGMTTSPGYFGIQTTAPMSPATVAAIRQGAGPGLIIP